MKPPICSVLESQTQGARALDGVLFSMLGDNVRSMVADWGAFKATNYKKYWERYADKNQAPHFTTDYQDACMLVPMDWEEKFVAISCDNGTDGYTTVTLQHFNEYREVNTEANTPCLAMCSAAMYAIMGREFAQIPGELRADELRDCIDQIFGKD